MEEALEILNYLPKFYKNRNEQEYIEFLWDAFESNYQNGKYQFAFIGYHMLFMSFVYFNIWQIKKILEEDYNKSILGFDSCFENASSPFTFSQEKERRIFTLFRVLGMEKDKIGQYQKIVDRRNEIAHSNGNIFFKAQQTIDDEITKILKFAEEIQQNSKTAIQHCFERFLIESQNEEKREYLDISEQIREVLIHQHYMSQKDLEYCMGYDINKLSDEPNFTEIEKIYETLKSEYSE